MPKKRESDQYKKPNGKSTCVSLFCFEVWGIGKTGIIMGRKPTGLGHTGKNNIWNIPYR